MEIPEFIIIMLLIFGAYYWGLMSGYNMDRAFEEQPSVLNAEILQDENTDMHLAYELATKKFLGQATSIELLVDVLTTKFPNRILVLSRTQTL